MKKDGWWKTWLLHRYGSLETVCGVWVPSRYAAGIATVGLVLLCMLASIPITIGLKAAGLTTTERAGIECCCEDNKKSRPAKEEKQDD